MELKRYLDNLDEQLAHWSGGETFILPPDCAGNGYDIAVALHSDAYAEVQKIGDKHRTSVSKIYANGAFCGYVLRKPLPAQVTALCQHSGNWGPWYHISVYERTPRGTWRHISRSGHYNARCTPKTDGVGHPSTWGESAA